MSDVKHLFIGERNADTDKHKAKADEHHSVPSDAMYYMRHTEETRIERDTCTPMFIAALFIIARTRKQSRCPSADEWIRKL